MSAAAAPAPRAPLPVVQIDKALARRLKGLRVVITGPCTGVGRNIAQIYAAHGACVGLADILDCAHVVEECLALGATKAVFLRFNAGLEGEGARMVKEAAAALGPASPADGPGAVDALDAVILNHTVGVFRPLFNEPDPAGLARRNALINYLGSVDVQLAAMPHLFAGARQRRRRRRELDGEARAAGSASSSSSSSSSTALPADCAHNSRSSLLAISTLAAAIPMLGTHGYAASKAATNAWIRCVRLELGTLPELAALVGVSLVHFSAIKTESLMNALGPADGPNAKAIALASDPMDAAWAVVRAADAKARETFFPSNIGALPRLYSCWPWLVRRIVSSVVVKQVVK